MSTIRVEAAPTPKDVADGRPSTARTSSASPGLPWRDSALRLLLGLIVPTVALGGWLLSANVVPDHILPPPAMVGRELGALMRSGQLWVHIGVTSSRVAWGFLAGAAAAGVLGALAGYSPLARAVVDPTVQALKAVPSLAWVPLFIVWFGIFETSKIVLIAVGVFFPIYVNLSAAVLETDRKLVEVAVAFGLSRWATIRRVLIPAALPGLVTGLRSGLALGWMFVIAAEIMGASEGLGFLMVDGQMTGRPAVIIASLLVFAVMGQLTDQLLKIVFRPALRWQDSLQSHQGRRR